MHAKRYAAASFVAYVAIVLACPAFAQDRLDPDAIRTALKTTVIEDDNYIPFLVKLLDQGRLPRVAFDTSFRWARQKSYLKFQFFKRAVIANADRMGITLPDQTPPLREKIQGRVMQHVLLADVPVPFADVRIVGTDFKTKTDLHGRFTFADVPWASYTVEADGNVLQLMRKVSAQVKLPFLPNDPTSLTLTFR